MEPYILISFGISMNILFFLMGYSWCKIMLRDKQNNEEYVDKLSRKKDEKHKNKKLVDIDSSTVVVDIKTNDLEKKYESLGEIQKSEEKITDSVSKLKNLKR